MTERDYLVALSTFITFGPVRVKLLRNYFGSYEKAWKASSKELSEIGLRKPTVVKFINHRDKFEYKKFRDNLSILKIQTVTILDANYPINLGGLDDIPSVLYFRGKSEYFDETAVAIVGSRKMTSYGKQVAQVFAQELALVGVMVVSGLAFGIDVVALKAVVDAGGKAVAVLASGVDVITPRSNEWLGKEIINKGGLIVSEYPPGTIPQKQFFPFRNRIISGLSKAVVVVEGLAKSGTLHTASHAAKQGIEVFAVPGHITAPTSGAPHFLIRNGAKIAFSPKDIIDELDLQVKVDGVKMAKVLPSDELEEKIIEVLENEVKHIDQITRELGMDIQQVSAKLTIMQIKGMVVAISEGDYRLSQ